MIRWYRWLMFGLAVAGVVPKLLDLLDNIKTVTHRDFYLVLRPIIEAFENASGISIPDELLLDILQVIVMFLKEFYGNVKARTDQIDTRSRKEIAGNRAGHSRGQEKS